MSTTLIMVLVLIVSLAIAVWINAALCGEPKAKKLLCRLGFHNFLIDTNERQDTLKCVDCPHEETNEYVE